MALALEKQVKSPEAKIIKLYDSALEEYLKQFDISKDVFCGTKATSLQDKVILKKYYDEEFERAITLLTDDEVVGIAFDNLEIIEKILGENKLVKRMK